MKHSFINYRSNQSNKNNKYQGPALLYFS